MGIDYSANHGLGVRFTAQEVLDVYNKLNDDNSEDAGCAIEDLDLPKWSYYFEIGDGNYTGKNNDFCICIDDALEKGILGLKEKSNNLISYLRNLGFETPDEIESVGGLHIW